MDPRSEAAHGGPPGSWRSIDEPAERCQGRSLDERKRRVRPCACRPVFRVTGTHRLAADLCGRHARVALDRPRLLREWLLQEDADGVVTGRTPAADRDLEASRPAQDADLVLRVAAELGSLNSIRSVLSRALERHGWPDELHAPLLLAVTEASINAIEHGSPPGAEVEVALTVDSERVAVQVADTGRLGAALPLGPRAAPPTRSTRGRGLLLMQRLAERVQIHSSGRGTSVLLDFARPAATGPGVALGVDAVR